MTEQTYAPNGHTPGYAPASLDGYPAAVEAGPCEHVSPVGQLDADGHRIQFGQRDNQTHLPSIALEMLARLHDGDPGLFGELAAGAMTDEAIRALLPVIGAAMLTALREHDARLFGELSMAAMTGEVIDLHATKRKRGRCPSPVTEYHGQCGKPGHPQAPDE
jgi:hypothetical protein